MVGFQQQTQKNHSNLVPIAQVEHEITKRPGQSSKRSYLGLSTLPVQLGWGRGEETSNDLQDSVRLESV